MLVREERLRKLRPLLNSQGDLIEGAKAEILNSYFALVLTKINK